MNTFFHFCQLWAVKTTEIMIAYKYTIPLCNFGFAYRNAICVIVKDFGKALLKTKILPDFLFIQTIQKETVIWNCPVSKLVTLVTW